MASMKRVSGINTLLLYDMNKRMIMPLVAAVIMVLFAGCKKETIKVSMNFGAQIEPPAGEDKTYLVNEKWIYWDADDEISVRGKSDDRVRSGRIVSGANSTLAFFRADDLSDDSEEFIFLFPHNPGNMIDFDGGVQVNFPDQQHFRDDLTFGKESCPMVGWCLKNDQDSILFHSLAGLARVQLYSTAGDKEISQITFEEVSEPKQNISGMFRVKDYSEYDPYLVAGDGNKTITITCDPETRVVGSSQGDLCTFYLVLPALEGTTTYKLRMTVKTTDGKQFQKTFGVKVRRNSIMKVPALNITAWADAPNAGTADISIVGNGTELRPFQIYTAAELAKVRDAINSGGKINGQTITSSTQFALMRSDIVLDATNWTSGIDGFVGHFYYAAASSVTTPGITNNSKIPIFTSIAAGGVVEGLTLKGTFTNNSNLTTSPLCDVNRGVIKDCRTSSSSSFTLSSSNSASGIAGICVTNEGTITGCSHNGTLTCSNGTAGGICLNNRGTITGCFMETPGRIAAKWMGGIAYRNYRTVRSSYFSASMTGVNGIFGGIVYRNDQNVQNCMLYSPSQIKSGKSLGGVVYVNYATVDSCYSNAAVFEGKDTVGGIVAVMRGGEVRNSYFNAGLTNIKFTGNGLCGGFVAYQKDGAIRNCYVRARINAAAATYGGFVGRIDGGSIENVYSRIYNSGDKFFGAVLVAATLKSCYNYGVIRQAGVISFTNPNDGIGDHANLAAALNNWVSNAGGDPYRRWTTGDNPTLE